MAKMQRAFTLIEVLVVIAIIALLIGILLPSLNAARHAGRHSICLSNLGQLARASATYAVDFQDRIPTYTWEPGKKNSSYPDLNYAPSWSTAQMDQAVDILRRRADREDIPRLTGRIPHRRYTHLIVNDYMSQQLPEFSMACPEDKVLQDWQRNPRDEALLPPGEPAFHKMWPYSSSYQFVPAAWAADTGGSGGSTVTQYTGDHNLFWMGSKPLGKRKLGEVEFSMAKVMAFDFHDRHSSKHQFYHAYPQATAPMAMFDGSARAVRTADSNFGFKPDQPSDPAATFYYYSPSILQFEPPTLSGLPQELVAGHYRWTRGGLRGVDFGMAEIDTGQK